MNSRPWSEHVLERLRRSLTAHGAVQVGETTVISHHVHMSDAYEPGAVRVLTSADAGRVFYGRVRRSEVVHVDVFHQVGEVCHRRIAHTVLDAMSPAAGAEIDGGRLTDQVDVQTATGGGRITGDLRYGERESLKKAHSNHVHIAVRSHSVSYELLLPIVQAVEEEIVSQGLEIRRVEQVRCEHGGSGNLDLSPYSGPSDSALREGSPGREPGTEPDGAGGGQGEAGSGNSETGGSGDVYGESLTDALDLAGDVGTLEELKVVLNHIRDHQHRDDGTQDPGLSGWERQTLVESLKSRGLVTQEGRCLRLTPRGDRLRRYLREYREEIMRMLRRLARRAPRLGLRPDTAGANRSDPCRYGRRSRLVGLRGEEGADELAIAESVNRSLHRGMDNGEFRFCTDDLRYYRRRQVQTHNICLLIDASASMAGKRLRAARHLAHHLVLATRDRVAVVVFQERATRIICPFTRDRSLLERSIGRMQAFGLTPLAGAIADTLAYLKTVRSGPSLLLLITDGVPTIPRWSLNPLIDAIQAAKEIPRRRLPFACVGLEPNRSFLDRLSRAAGGNLYIVDELDRDVLVAIARRERTQA